MPCVPHPMHTQHSGTQAGPVKAARATEKNMTHERTDNTEQKNVQLAKQPHELPWPAWATSSPPHTAGMQPQLKPAWAVTHPGAAEGARGEA